MIEVVDVRLVEVPAPGVEVHHLLERRLPPVVEVGAGQLDVAHRGDLERAVHGHALGRGDRRGQGGADVGARLGEARERHREAERILGAHAEIVGRRPDADVVEAHVVHGELAVPHLHPLDQPRLGEVADGLGGELRPTVALVAVPLPEEDRQAALLGIRERLAVPVGEPIEGAVVRDEGRLVALQGEAEEEREVRLHQAVPIGGRLGGVPVAGEEGRGDHARVGRAETLPRRIGRAAEHTVRRVHGLLREGLQVEELAAHVGELPPLPAEYGRVPRHNQNCGNPAHRTIVPA